MEWSGKPWNSFDASMRQRFGRKVIRLSVDGGMTCPNRDGTLSFDGCLFCSSESQRPGGIILPVEQQLEQRRMELLVKWPDGMYIAYFQSFSNTYGDLNVLQELYERALAVPGIEGLAIATRPDCLNSDTIELLAEMGTRVPLWVELGLQTIHDSTAERIGRGYDWQLFMRVYEKLKVVGIASVIHLINGLPGETREMMMDSAREVGRLETEGLKLHLLHVMRNTGLAPLYQSGDFVPMEMGPYIQLICDQLEWIPKQTAIHRLTGDGDRRWLLAPLWSSNKKAVLNGIFKEMRARNSWQGKCLEGLK